MNRRDFVAGSSLVATGSLAGCLDFILGDGPAEFSAGPARVRQDALDETGYQLDDRSSIDIEREFEVGDESREVVITNSRANYDKAVSAGPLDDIRAAVFSILTTRQASVLGREFNPVAEMSPRRLLEFVQDRHGNLDDLEYEDESEVTVANETTTQEVFSGTSSIEGVTVEIRLHVTEAVELGDDLAVTVGVYPELIPQEEENIYELMAATESGED